MWNAASPPRPRRAGRTSRRTGTPPPSRRRPASRMIASPCRAARGPAADAPEALELALLAPREHDGGQEEQHRRSRARGDRGQRPARGSWPRAAPRRRASIAGKRSNMRCAKTDPISVAVVPLRPRQCAGAARRRARARRRAPAARRSRTGRRENAEKTSREARVRRRDRLLDRRVPRERAREHREQVEPDRGRDPLPRDRGERVVHDDASPGRARRSATTATRATQTECDEQANASASRRHLEVGLLEPPRDVVPARSSRARARAPRGPSRRGAPRRRARR